MLELIRTTRFDTDVLSIYEWLDDRREGSGEVFYRELLVAMNRLALQPWSGSQIQKAKTSARHFFLPRNRHAIIYTVELRRIVLHSVFDQRRDPGILERLVSEITGGLPGPRPIP